MGQVADRYKRRVAVLGRENARLRGDVAKALTQALQSATAEELYNLTPLPVSGQMRGSIQPFFTGSNEVQVGFNARKARHARRRLNLKGTSKSGGHKLDMRPAPIVARIANPQIRRLTRAAQRRTLEGS